MTQSTPTKVRLTTTFQPLVAQLSGSLAAGARLIDQCLHDEPTPQKMMDFARALSILLREVGRRSMAWGAHHGESASNDEAPSRLQGEGRVSRRRGQHRTAISTLFGTIEVWRRLYEPLEQGQRAIHPLALRLGVEAGVAPSAVAERVGRWTAEHTQRHVLAM